MRAALYGTIFFLSFTSLLTSCREPDDIDPSTDTPTGEGEDNAAAKGFYVLCEGSYGNNDSSLDYYDYTSGIYSRNIYAERNPQQVMGLGDVGNDLGIYGNKLYAVIGCSHRVEVMETGTAKHLGSFDLMNCRYLAFDGGYAYVTSYGSNTPAVAGWGGDNRGYVAKVDTATLQIVDTCMVGYQPEEMAVLDGRLYVANSGGYRVPDYDHTVSVIDLETFSNVGTFDVGTNLHRMEAFPQQGLLAVTSRGDYYQEPGALHLLEAKSGKEVASWTIGSNAELTAKGDTLYLYSSDWGSETCFQRLVLSDNVKSMNVPDTLLLGGDGLAAPYGMAVNPATGDLLVCDARDYITPGRLHSYHADGSEKWTTVTGVIPSRIAFVK